MGLIIGIFVRLFTFPGIILDAFVLEKLCHYFNIKVVKVNYFSIMGKELPVEHEEISSYRKIVGLTIIPFFIMSLIAILSFLIGLIVFYENLIEIIFVWLGISIAAHSFPSSNFGKLLWSSSITQIKNNNFIAIIGFPVVILIYIARILHIFWLDIIYGILLLILIDHILIAKGFK